MLISEDDFPCDTDAQRQEVWKLINILFLNLSQCFLETKIFESAFLAADQAMCIDDKNPKAYYRQTRALEGLDTPESLKQAIDCIETGIKYCVTDQDKLRFDQMSLELHHRLEEKMFPKAFGSYLTKTSQSLNDDTSRQHVTGGKVVLEGRSGRVTWSQSVGGWTVRRRQ